MVFQAPSQLLKLPRGYKSFAQQNSTQANFRQSNFLNRISASLISANRIFCRLLVDNLPRGNIPTLIAGKAKPAIRLRTFPSDFPYPAT
jgi:hypothetical protein